MKRKIVYGKGTCVEKDGIITLTQIRKIGCMRKQYISTKEIKVSELSNEELIAFRGMDAYRRA